MLASFQAGLALKMEKASQQTQLNTMVSHPEFSLPNGSCHSSGITSDWTKLGHLMFPESITEATGLENSGWPGPSHMPIPEPMGGTSLTPTTWSAVREGLSEEMKGLSPEEASKGTDIPQTC